MVVERACPQCGASQREGTCREQVHSALLSRLREDDPAYTLAAACFTLQHPAGQAKESLSWARFHLEGTLEAPTSRDAVRARASRRMAAMAGPLPRLEPSLVVWQVTVAELPALPGNGTERARVWARATLADLSRGQVLS